MNKYQPSNIDVSWQQDPEHMGFVREHLGLTLDNCEKIPDMTRVAIYRYARIRLRWGAAFQSDECTLRN